MSTVLVVEDDESYQKLLAGSLQSEGLTVRKAKNGKDALTVLQENDVDVILLDILMPQMDGIAFVYEMNKTAHKNIPIIILTNLTEASYPENVKALLIKANTSIEDVVSKVKQYLP